MIILSFLHVYAILNKCISLIKLNLLLFEYMCIYTAHV